MIKRLSCAASIAAALFAAPAHASGFAELPPAAAVAQFAEQRNGAPLWLRGGVDGPAVRQLLSTLRRAPLDGFAQGPRLAEAARAALARAGNGRAEDRLEAERLLSAAWVMYVQALHWPGGGTIYSDPALAPRIPQPAAVLRDLVAAGSLERHIAQVSAVNPIYAELREALARETDERVRQTLRANLERARVLPGEGRFVLVDLASQRLWMMEEGRPAGEMKVIVGKSEMKTPLIAGTLHAVTLNPYWNVPPDLVRRNIAPAALRGGSAYLRAKGYELFSAATGEAQPVAPESVDWQAVADDRAAVRVRQKPGAGNMMGGVKFEFAKAQGIYLHDTPDRALFASGVRTFSSGCIRLEDAARLGRWLMGRDLAAEGDVPEQVVALPQLVPVYVTYLTARVEGGRLALAPDVYGLDGLTDRQLASR
jgi:murein L,D-transpeptidase YcbB/YkuD